MKIKKTAIILLSLASIYLSCGQDISDLKPKMMNVEYFKVHNDNFHYQKMETAIEEHDAVGGKPVNWDSLVDTVRNQDSDYMKVAMANLIANQIPYADGTNGTYFSPLIGMRRGGMVCKDFAVFKYLLLKEAGYPIDRMALLIHQSVLNPDTGAHVVLIVEIDKELWIANQFWNSTAQNFYKDYHINPAKFSKEIRKNGVAALKTDWDLTDNKYNKKSLTKLKDYAYTDRLILSVVNEYGVMSEKKLNLAKMIGHKKSKHAVSM